MGERYAFVMMIRDRWWRAFLGNLHRGKQMHSYVRGGAAPPKSTSLIFFYVTKPVAEVSGYAEFVERKVGDAEELWKKYGDESVLSSEEEYLDLVKGKRQVSFIRFRSLQKAAEPVGLNNFLTFLGVDRLARAGFYISKEVAEKLIQLMES
ncbi:MAG: hypothetical protein ACE5L6_01725 [Candidatus Bathyarchaeia archaeon]